LGPDPRHVAADGDGVLLSDAAPGWAVRTPSVPCRHSGRRDRGGRLTPRSTPLVALGATALTFATTTATAQPAQAVAAAQPPAPKMSVTKRRLNVRAGRRVLVRGAVAPAAAGLPVTLQIQRAGRWRTLARARTDARGAFTLRHRVK